MTDRIFVIMQIGAENSLERKRADEIYDYIISPVVTSVGLDPYRADLDLSPGAITPKMLTELLSARAVIADLTGRNPNVFYELGITHSFVRPLISIADSVSSLPFDTKDERIIILGEYSSGGLGYIQVENAKKSLQKSRELVLAEDYSPPSPLLEVAAARSVDALAPDNPLAAEMAQIRGTLEEIHMNLTSRRTGQRFSVAEVGALRHTIDALVMHLSESDLAELIETSSSRDQQTWANKLYDKWLQIKMPPVYNLLQTGRNRGGLSLSELRSAFENAGLTASEARTALRVLSAAGVRLVDEDIEIASSDGRAEEKGEDLLQHPSVSPGIG
jgi:hypothetical protein